MTKQELPKWFDGTLYTEGDVVENPFTGYKYPLNAMELSMYDFIMGCQMLVEAQGGLMNPSTAAIQTQMSLALSWFRKHNAPAYMVLLD